MKTRSTKELLIILRDNLTPVIKKDKLIGGMCGVIQHLNYVSKEINTDERFTLNDYLKNNKPSNAFKRQKKYMYESINSDFILSSHWWKPRAIAPRIKWLNEQINKL